MGKLNHLLFCLVVTMVGVTNVQAQYIGSDISSIFNNNRGSQLLSPSAQIFVNPSLRNSLVPKFDGKYDAQLLVNEEFTLPIKVDLLSEIDDLETRGNRFIHVRFNENDWAALINQKGLLYIDLSAKINSPRPLNDTARVHSRVDLAENGLANQLSQNYTGKGVLIGVVDIGFQTDHPTFFNSEGRGYRVLRFWNQQQKSGTAPVNFAYGSEYLDSQTILSAIDDDG